jgi:hypothetical protein
MLYHISRAALFFIKNEQNLLKFKKTHLYSLFLFKFDGRSSIFMTFVIDSIKDVVRGFNSTIFAYG